MFSDLEATVSEYTPTDDEKEATLSKGNFLRLSGDGIFATLQGEGATAGAPAVFLRLHDCNLHCGAGGEGWRCDAWYTWDRTTAEFWQESTQSSIETVADGINDAWSKEFTDAETSPRLVVTGGEPLLQQAKLLELLKDLHGWNTEIETNGTIVPHPDLANCQINCSPKLASSGNALRARYNAKALRAIANFPNHWFKFVISELADLDEVEQIVEANDLEYSRVLLMSEGTDARLLREKDKRLESIAQTLGCAVTARNQIFWYGDRRAT